MAIFEVEGPDGGRYQVDAPDMNTAVGVVGGMSSGPANASGDAKPKGWMKTVDDYMGMAAKGLSFGLADRIGAVGDTLTGRGSYDSNLARNRTTLNQIEADHPIAAPVTETIAGMAGPVGAVGAIGRGATMLQKVGAGLLSGAGLGAVQGAADAQDFTNVGDTAKHTAIGAGVGGLLGASIPVAARGVGTAYNAIADATRGKVEGVSNGAASHLLSALKADNPANVRSALQQLGPEAMLADAGPAFLGKAQGAAVNSDDGRSILTNALTDRRKGANGRIQGTVDDAIGRAEDPVLATENILTRRSAVDGVNYPRAHASAPPVDITQALAMIGQKLETSEGMEKKALTNLRDALLREKEFPIVNAGGSPVMTNGPSGQQTPLMETRMVPKDRSENIHNIRQEIDHVTNYGAPGLGVPSGALQNKEGALQQARSALDSALKGQVPGFAGADAASSALAKRAEAVKLGTSVLDSGKQAMTPEALRIRYEAMAPGERAALAKGTRGEIERQLDTKANDLVAGKNVIKGDGDWNRERLSTVFGPDATNRIIAKIDAEAKFHDTANKVVDNSQSAQRLTAARAMKPEPSSQTPIINPSSTLFGTMATAGKSGAAKVISMLRPDPTRSFGEIAGLLTQQGAARDKTVSGLLDAMSRREANQEATKVIEHRAALASGLLADAGRRRLSAKQQQRR